MLERTETAGGGELPAAWRQRSDRYSPEFSGQAGEYFGIWFVNLLLSIVTLGIYSAWAKVRTERYFYGNTRLAGSTFEYLASPIAILKGRLIAYAVVIALTLSSYFAVEVYFGLLVLVFALMPMAIVLGLAFRARNSAWRGVTFHFDRSPGSGYGPFLGWPILTLLTGTLVLPVMKKRQHEYVASGHRFGRQPFGFSADIGVYFTPYLVALGLWMALIVAFIAVFAVAMIGRGGAGSASPAAAGMALVGAIVLLYAGMFAMAIFVQVRYANLFWNSTSLGAHRFESSLRVRDMLLIYFTNLVAIVCTIGLAAPWAMIRLARYRAAHFAVITEGSIEEFLAAAEGPRSATGAEIVDALDVGVDFGV